MDLKKSILCTALGLCLAGAVMAAPKSAQTSSKTPKERVEQSAQAHELININKADAEGLAQLKGVGPSKAKAIISYRTQHGHFKSVNDLTNVPGISNKLLEKIQAQITVG